MKPIKAYNKINDKLWYVSDELHISKKQRLYSKVLDATYLLHKKGFTPGDIGNFLGIPEPGVKNIFKQLNLNTHSDNIPVVKIHEIPGVAYFDLTNDYYAYTHIHNEAILLGIYKTKFHAAFAVYRSGSEQDSPAAKYVKKQCKDLGCDLCYEYGMKLLPMKCERFKNPNALKPITETNEEFLIRAKKIVKETKKR